MKIQQNFNRRARRGPQSCSWNRKEPTGYKIVTIDMNDLEVNDFATGWLKEGNVLGRPVDIITNDDGSLFVSDDNAGKIYRVYYEN